MEDKRKFPRVRMSTAVSIACGDEQRLELAEIDDLTVEGLSFLVAHALEKGSRLFVLFPSTQDVHETEIAAEVVRCEAVGSAPGLYRVCVRFHEPQDAFLMDALALVHGRRGK